MSAVRGDAPSASGSSADGSWPVHPTERTWGRAALMGVCMSAAVATWIFIIGGYVAYYLPAGTGTVTMLAGALVGIGLIVLAMVPVTGRFGIDSIAASRPQLGTRGSYLGLGLLYFSVLGWNCLLMVFLGRATAEILIAIGAIGEGARDAVVTVSALVGIAVVALILRGGPTAMRNAGPVIAVCVSLLSIYVLALLIGEVGLGTIADAEPSAPTGDKLADHITGFEIVMVTNLSWWPYLGAMIRLAPSARHALWPVILGLGLPVGLMSLIGLYAALAVPDSGGDPTAFLVEVGGTGAAIPALAFILIANIGTVLVGAYVNVLGLKQVPAIERRLGWNATGAIALVPLAILVAFFSGWVFDNVGTFLAFLGVGFAPLVGLQIADYHLLRRGRVDLRGMFVSGPGSPYHFWGGVNPAGLAAFAAGAATYIYLLDPVNYTMRAPYQYLSATLPAAFIAGLVFWLVTRVVVQPAGRGGYGRDGASPPVPAVEDTADERAPMGVG